MIYYSFPDFDEAAWFAAFINGETDSLFIEVEVSQ